MSLTSQLRSGELSRWCTTHLPGSVSVAGQVADAVTETAVLRAPAGPGRGPRHGAQVGGVFGARMAALVQDAPPYYALLGMHAGGLVSLPGAHAIAAEFGTHQRLEPKLAQDAMNLHPSPTDWLLIAGPTGPAGPAGWGDRVFAELAARGRRFHAEHAPTGQIGTPGAERALARAYGAWSAAEDTYRSPSPPAALLALQAAAPDPTLEQVRALCPQPVVDDVAALARRLADSGSLATLWSWAGNPAPGEALGYSGPVFCPHWADGDLLVGDTLVDVKAVTRADDRHTVLRWLWQLLGYAWIDEGDRWRIRHLALYLARHGALIRWSVDEVAGLLVGDAQRVPEVRAEFRSVTRRLAAAEGATWIPAG
ncbi:MAG: hypothetical protein L0I76_33985 [Pseudonocardia sp.]|nr:hypothetical protein [Pseudonocardia sp.]